MMTSLFEKFKHNHLLMMIICCAVPLVGIVALSFLGMLGSWAYYALLLLCPLGHFLMMRVKNHHTEGRQAPEVPEQGLGKIKEEKNDFEVAITTTDGSLADRM